MKGIRAGLSEGWRRAELDLAARRALYAGAPTIRVAQEGVDFWRWYASVIRPRSVPDMDIVPNAPTYTAEQNDTPFALWYSGGVESTYTKSRIAHLEPDYLHIEDFPHFKGPDRAHGQIHFICAVIAAALGYRTCYMGIERNDLLIVPDPAHSGFIERSPTFVDQWNAYCPTRQLHSVCRTMYKEEVLAELCKAGLPIKGTCDNFRDGRWCGHCFKCFEAFYTAKAINIDLGIKLDRIKCQRYYTELSNYIGSGFRDNYNNAYQHFVRLQITYHLSIDPEHDCQPQFQALKEAYRANG